MALFNYETRIIAWLDAEALLLAGGLLLKRAVMNWTSIMLLVAIGCGCATRTAFKGGATRQEVVDALARTQGAEAAEERYVSWMKEVRLSCPDNETAHRKILGTLERIEKMVVEASKQIDETRERLLSKTDHRGVLTAARQVMETRHEYGHDPAVHGPGNSGTSHISADDPRLPIALLKIGAARLIVTDRLAIIEFGGGFHHFGLLAIAEDQGNGEARSGPRQEWKWLVDGLYFYEDTR